MTKQQIVKNANSQGMILDYYGVTPNGSAQYFPARSPIFNPNNALKVIRADPVVKGAIITMVDSVLEGGWRIEAKDGKSRTKELEKKLKEVKFDLVLRKALFNLILYNNAYIEIVKKNGELSDLNVLETTLMEIKSLDNGDVIEYTQNVGGRNTPSWKPENIVHIKLDEISSNVFSDDNIQVLWDTILIKDAVRDWLKWFFQTNQMRGIFSIKGANATKVKEFVSYLKAAEKDKTKPHIIEGEVSYSLLNNFSEQGKTLGELLDWCDMQIMILLQVPPIAVGKADSSGRSNSVEQNSAMHTRVNNIHELLETYFTYDLFKKIGYDKSEFCFGTENLTSMRTIFETVQMMKNSMFSDEAILEFLDEQGVFFETNNVFKDPVEEAKKMAEMQQEVTPTDTTKSQTNKSVGTGNEGSIGNKSADAAPSRLRQSSQTISKANQTTMVKNSKFDGYPYTFEAKQ